jgi:hypothetical protein
MLLPKNASWLRSLCTWKDNAWTLSLATQNFFSALPASPTFNCDVSGFPVDDVLEPNGSLLKRRQGCEPGGGIGRVGLGTNPEYSNLEPMTNTQSTQPTEMFAKDLGTAAAFGDRPNYNPAVANNNKPRIMFPSLCAPGNLINQRFQFLDVNVFCQSKVIA